ncbi:MAG: FtsX-like permease family protein [Buchnera aphidicola (Kaburagia rhusicola ensigallis)]
MIYLSFLISKKLNIQFKKNSITYLVSIVSKIGIFLGVLVLIISFSALNGFKFELNNRILSILPHGEILPTKYPFQNWKKIKNLLKFSPDIISIVPYVSTTALVNHINGIKGIQLKGLNFDSNHEPNNLYKFINKKTLKKIKKNEYQVILGKSIATYLSIHKGDWINIVFSDNYHSSTLYPKYIFLQVLDFFNINSSLDDTLALVPMSDLQRYLNMRSNISGLELSIKDPFDGNKIFKKIQHNLPNNFIIKNWMIEYNYIYHEIQLVKTIIYFAMILIIIISCCSIASITLFNISKKIKSIAIFKTLGINNNSIKFILLIYGIKSIFKIGLLSLLLSMILLFNFQYFIYYIEKYLGYKLVSSAVYFIDFIPISIAFSDIFLIFFILFLIGFITSYYPANYASKIDPATILKKY